ncbi:MAG: HAD family phosphatase [Verrucomicrobiota bacterium]|nr:HAD family phosphatase [Verrucomicrobiota bacterium]
MIKAILMDFNGVIINDEPLQLKAYQEILKGEGIDLTEEQYYSCMGMNDRELIEAAFKFGKKELPAEKVAGFITQKTAKWREIVDEDIPLFDGVENFVRKMAQEFALGVVSMARREEIEYVLEKMNLLGCFAAIVSADDVSASKPDPECYLTGFNEVDAVRTRLGGNPIVHKDCVVIEDAPAGIVAGKRAGLRTLGITNTVSADKLREAGADVVSKSLADWMPDSFRRVFT